MSRVEIKHFQTQYFTRFHLSKEKESKHFLIGNLYFDV